LSDADRCLYLGLLQEYSKRHSCAVHAYVLMTNHIHLLVSPPEIPSISRMMRSVNQIFGQHLNRKNNRCGSVWQGRFKACVVDTKSYFLNCQRYIELNPLRAGMVGHPGRYAWSSYRNNGEGEPSELISPHGTFLALGSTPLVRQATYRAFLEVPVPEEELSRIRTAIQRNRPLGDDAFVLEAERLQALGESPVPHVSQVPVPYLSPVWVRSWRPPRCSSRP
ncbi:MAG TPA: transposase, partial [Usitatibacter sp.]|nr:transposase [Usitatibacter sp.]